LFKVSNQLYLKLKWVIQKSRYNVKSLAKILEGCEREIASTLKKLTSERASREDNMTVYRVITETFIEADGEHEAELKVNDKKNKWELIDVHEYQKEIPSKINKQASEQKG